MQFLLCLLVGVGWLFAFCHFGNKATESFLNLSIFIYRLDWYEFPPKMQKDLQLMIAISQENIYIQGFGNTRCTREMFKKVHHLIVCNRMGIYRKKIKFMQDVRVFQVIHATFSSFMVLRSFS